MKSDNIRLRLIKVLEILRQKSDPEHPVSSGEILDELKKYGIEAERKSIYRDIEALRDSGLDIVLTGIPKKGYYLSTRAFSLPEVSFLIDAVQSAGFIPKNGTKSLVKKLQSLLSEHQSVELKDRVCIDNRLKSNNESVYDIIEILNEAIKAHRKVKIQYAKSYLDGTELKVNCKEMVVSPYALLWEADRYYLIGNNKKYDNITHLRVDRIAEVSIMREEWRHFSEVSEYSQRFDIADYSRKTFNMFGGEKQRIDLECKIELLDQITDRFTDGIFIRHGKQEPTFRFSTDVLVSDGLVGWLMQFGGDIKVLSPESLKRRVLANAERLVEVYEK